MSELDESVQLGVTRREALELCAGLRAYMRSMEKHAEGDRSRAHAPGDLDRMRLHFGQLIWRLEEAAFARPGVIVDHGEDAVSPEQRVDWP